MSISNQLPNPSLNLQKFDEVFPKGNQEDGSYLLVFNEEDELWYLNDRVVHMTAQMDDLVFGTDQAVRVTQLGVNINTVFFTYTSSSRLCFIYTQNKDDDSGQNHYLERIILAPDDQIIKLMRVQTNQ